MMEKRPAFLCRAGRRTHCCAVAVVCVAASLSLAGCESIALGMFSVGANAGVSHQINSIAYRTFNESLSRVKMAVGVALDRMEIPAAASERMENGEVIRARVSDRNIEIELEILTPATTRMKVMARRDIGILADSATASEIIAQTEKALGSPEPPPLRKALAPFDPRSVE